MVSNNGPAAVDLNIDAVRGTDVAKITHSLSDKTLNGWQSNASDRTPLNAVTVHFDLANGVARTNSLALSGPVVQMSGAGTIDKSTKTLQMKVNPRIADGQQNIARVTCPSEAKAPERVFRL
jgi:AsmA protein